MRVCGGACAWSVCKCVRASACVCVWGGWEVHVCLVYASVCARARVSNNELDNVHSQQ